MYFFYFGKFKQNDIKKYYFIFKNKKNLKKKNNYLFIFLIKFKNF